MQRLVPWLVVGVLAVGCAGERDERNTAAEGTLPARGGPAASGAAEFDGGTPARVALAGTLTNALDVPIGGRTITLVDARGARGRGSTDADGRFTFEDVAVPYDLAAAGEQGAPFTVVAGLTRSDPHIVLTEGTGSIPGQHVVRVAVPCAACPTPTCSLEATTSSASGGGAGAVDFAPDDDTCAVDVLHVGGSAAGEAVEVTVLVRSDDGESFAFGHVQNAPSAADVELVDVAVAPPPAVVRTTLAVSTDEAALDEWPRHTTLALALSPRTTLDVAERDDASPRVPVPVVPGATLRAAVEATHPNSDQADGFFRVSEAWSGDVPVQADVSVHLPTGPELVRPGSSATLSRHGPGLAWSSAPSLAQVTLFDAIRGTTVLRAFTVGSGLRLARLAELELPPLEPGPHVVELTSWSSGSTDALTSGDPRERRQHDERSHPGARTVLRVAFQVTP